MSKVKTDKELIEKFLNRGVAEIYPSKEALREKLLSGERLRVYQGFDPSGPYLHVGHAMGIRALRILQELGHEVIFLVGDYTAKVGDPDKDTGREILSDEQIQRNMEGWKEQAGQLIDLAAITRFCLKETLNGCQRLHWTI
jgi:tyrosyl-tRNA synthetase